MGDEAPNNSSFSHHKQSLNQSQIIGGGNAITAQHQENILNQAKINLPNLIHVVKQGSENQQNLSSGH